MKPIDVSSFLGSLGLSLTIPDNGIRRATQGTEDFLAVYGTFGKAPAGQSIKMNGSIGDIKFDEKKMSLETRSLESTPSLVLTLDSATWTDQSEVRWAIDTGTWSAWHPDRTPVITDSELALQGAHLLHFLKRATTRMRSRAKFHPYLLRSTHCLRCFSVLTIGRCVWPMS